MKRSVLVVEDDRSIRALVERILRGEGYAVATAENGREALRALEANPDKPGLILLDLMMPVMNGAEFLEVVKRDARWQSLPIVVFSAAGQAARPALADLFLNKPLDLDHLLGVVARYCDA